MGITCMQSPYAYGDQDQAPYAYGDQSNPRMHTGVKINPHMHTGIACHVIPVCILGLNVIPICIRGLVSIWSPYAIKIEAKRKAAAAALKTVGEYVANNSPAPGKKYPTKPFYLDVHDEASWKVLYQGGCQLRRGGDARQWCASHKWWPDEAPGGIHWPEVRVCSQGGWVRNRSRCNMLT